MFSSTKVRKTADYAIKGLILILTWWFVYDQMAHEKDMGSIIDHMGEKLWDVNNMILILACILLMPINWIIEVFKWQFLLNRVEKIKFTQAVKAILTGISISSFTPNRIGDYMGRIFFLDPSKRVAGVFATILGNMAQLTTTILMGSLGLWFFLSEYLFIQFPAYAHWAFLFKPLIALMGCCTLFTYFNLSWLYRKFKKWIIRFCPKSEESLEALSNYSFRDLAHILLMSILRYLVFSFQLFLFLHVFGVHLPYIQAMSIIVVLYFILSIVPSIALSEVGIRGSIALYLFGLYFSSTGDFLPEYKLAVVGATSTLWTLNLAIPALIGSLIFLNKKLVSKKRKLSLC